jgi:glucuronate isomerase
MRVRVVCTTEDPVDDLEHHKKIVSDTSFNIRVVPSFRPDRALQIEMPSRFNEWVAKLEKITDLGVDSYSVFIEAIRKRHNYFHENGCRISDYGIKGPFSVEHNRAEVCKIFNRARSGKDVSAGDALIFKSAVMKECVRMDSEKGWAMQLHMGVLRNTNTRFMNQIGPDSGFDSMGDFEISVPLVRFLDRFDREKSLPRTVLYNINPRDNETVASIIGSFQEGPAPGKIQFGPGWWFNDTKEGMLRQMNALSNLGLLSRFIGMTTDSRSFLSFVRHDYFRRILCSMLGEDVERGELPDDIELLGNTARDICYNNAENYFGNS